MDDDPSLRHFAELNVLPEYLKTDHPARTIKQSVQDIATAHYAGFCHIGFIPINRLAGVGGMRRFVSAPGAIKRRKINHRSNEDEERERYPKSRKNEHEYFFHVLSVPPPLALSSAPSCLIHFRTHGKSKNAGQAKKKVAVKYAA